MGRQAEGAPGDFAQAVAREIRKEMGDKRLSGRGLAVVLGKSEKYARERVSGELAFTLNDIEEFAGYLGIDPEALVARAESATSNVTPFRRVGAIPEDESAPDLLAVAEDESVDPGED